MHEVAGLTRSAQALLASHDAHPPLPPPENRMRRVSLSVWSCGWGGAQGEGRWGGGGFTFADGNRFFEERNDEAVEVLVGVGNLHVWC